MTTTTTSEPTLAVEDLHVRRGGHEVIVGLSHAWGPGVHGITGPNGAGKSTLLRAVAGVIPYRGTVRIAGHDLGASPHLAKRHVGAMLDAADPMPYLTPREVLETFAAVRGHADAGLGEFASLVTEAALDLETSTLSTGQRRKLQLALALQGEPPLVLLDEPANALDLDSQEMLRSRVDSLREARRCVLVASHRLDSLDVPLDSTLEIRPAGA